MTPGGPSVSISLPISHVTVSGAYTEKISWFMNPISTNPQDIEAAASLWIPSGNVLRWEIRVVAYSGVYVFPAYVFYWEDTAEWITQLLSISATSGGTTNPSPGNYIYGFGSSVTVTATAYSGYYFDYWVLDGATVYSNPITVTMNSDRTLKAYFIGQPNTPST
ncbi:MAG: InlB B-repeat-containing protein, partial [Candidatus Bathyarchaeales archaeon]